MRFAYTGKRARVAAATNALSDALLRRLGAPAVKIHVRTYLRTLLHELLHHLDVTVLGLDDSFHTEGFFRRESSLVRQLLPPRAPARRASRTTKQMTLF